MEKEYVCTYGECSSVGVITARAGKCVECGYPMRALEPTLEEIKQRLEYLRGEIEAERISYGEIAELVSLKDYIETGDVLLLEWAGVPENNN